MEIVGLLEAYVKGGSVSEISDDLLRRFADDPRSLVHGTLVYFKDLGLDFRFEYEIPFGFIDAKEKIAETESLSLKYVMALFCLKYQHHLTSSFVDETLGRLV
jgi:hypothetical protein